MRLKRLLVPVALAISLSGCGGDDDPDSGSGDSERQGRFERALERARSASASDFPSAEGKTLQQIADTVRAVQAGLATSEFTPGRNRLAFGVIDQDNSFVYGPSAVYLAPTPGDPARGPFVAPADPLVVDPPFRSQGAALESDAVAAIYEAQVELDRPGRHAVLVVTKTGSGLVGGAAEISVKRSSAIPEPGERPPDISTPTVASVGGTWKRSRRACRRTRCMRSTSRTS